jgi:hypothetical protein
MKDMLDNYAHDTMDGEEETLFHILKMDNHTEARDISQVQDQQRNTITRIQDILNTFVTPPPEIWVLNNRQHLCREIERCI